jgi:hypothetical protein
MKLFGYQPIDYFNRWLKEPVQAVDGESVQSILDALNRHPLAQDETAQDYIMPAVRYREMSGRFRVYGENQDNWYCFVYDGDERQSDPPVYFETCLDLKLDHGLAERDIIDGDHVLVCPRFTPFLWQMLAQQLCLRLQSSGQRIPGVHGVTFEEPVAIGDPFVNPLGRDFPAGFETYVSPDAVCIPVWGAAFLNAESGRKFLDEYRPDVSHRWAET